MSEELTYINESEIQSSVERCLTFESGGLVMFLSTNFVIEIINDHSITPLPLVPPYIKGIINLRGQMLPIVDIRARMGKPQAEYTSKTCIVVLEVDSVPFGIIVDSVRQVMDIDLQDVRPIPVKRQEELLNGMVTLEDGSVLMSFDCRSLFVY
ncbi:MAG: chemotaxis protein CheW [Lachnospiraceae bacterium]|jgi:purine-binding chemotaxis protein CheW|nr:chemotaxis protein CheW [Lachnospiraceae bacterium]MCI9590491.1 chemotaxis protein CheW [Lachnospiraceae bacterium]